MDPADLTWYASRACPNAATCVEVAVDHLDEQVLIRNSQDPDTVLRFTMAEWRAFLEGVEMGEFS